MFSISIKHAHHNSAVRKDKDPKVNISYRFEARVQLTEKEEVWDEMVIQATREMSLEEAKDLYFECRSDYLDAIATEYSTDWKLKTFDCTVEEKKSYWLPSYCRKSASNNC